MDDVRPHAKIIGLVWLTLTAFIAALFALGLPYFAKLVSISLERRMAAVIGSPADKFTECSTKGNPAFQKLLTRLYPLEPEDQNIPIQVRVLENKAVNAFAYLGGEIFVLSGLISQTQSPEELAAVLAHEMEHIFRRHLIQAMMGKLLVFGLAATVFDDSNSGKILPQIMNLRFSVADEEQADHGALQRLQKAQIDRKGFIDFFKRRESQDKVSLLLSDHPSNKDRVAMADDVGPYPVRPVLTRREWTTIKLGLCK